MTDKARSDGARLIDSWTNAVERLMRAKSEVNRAECDVANTRNALAKWMLPDDAKPGEKIAIWHVDALIQVEVPMGPGVDPIVTIRTRGKYAERYADRAA